MSPRALGLSRPGGGGQPAAAQHGRHGGGDPVARQTAARAPGAGGAARAALAAEPHAGRGAAGAAAAGGDSGRRYMSIPRTDEPTLREMTSAPDRPLDKALVQELEDWCGDMECGHTKFMNLHRDCGADAVLGPDHLAKRIKTCWDPENKYDLIFAQIVRTPAARRLARPYVEPETSPWRKTILITERGSCRVENWLKIHGIGSTENKEERYRSERIQWAVHIFARQRPPFGRSAQAEGETPEVEDALRGLGTPVDLPRSLGRLTKF